MVTAPVLFQVEPTPSLLRAKRAVRYHRLRCRTLLNRNPNPAFPFFWTINPYRGCEIGCAYCFARYTHTFLDHEDPLDFEHEIYVKVNAPEVLATTADSGDLRGRPVAIGTATDPYQPAERRFQITRRILAVLASVPTLELSITTKSDLIRRDLDLLTAIARTRPLTVHVSVSSSNTALLRMIEPGAPTPELRFETLAALRAAGIDAGLFVMPILPHVADSEADLARLFAGAHAAGASFVSASLLHLRAAPRRRFFPFLAAHFPEHLAWYRQAYARSAYLRGPEREAIVERIRRLRAHYGFMRSPAADRRCPSTVGARPPALGTPRGDQLAFTWERLAGGRAPTGCRQHHSPRRPCPR